MTKSYLNICTVFLALCSGLNAWSQVGIDELVPNQNAALDAKAIDKGLVIPRLTSAERFALKTKCGNDCPNGLLVYDEELAAFFYLSANQWYCLNPFVAPDVAQNASEDIYTNSTIKSIGVGTAPAANTALTVDGKVQFQGTLRVQDEMNITTGNLQVNQGDVNVHAGSLIVRNDITSTFGNVRAGTNSSTGRFSSNVNETTYAGPVPRFGIVMWSGSVASIPSGYALCNGSNGTPDLRGRFVVGYDPDVDDYDVLGEEGGIDFITLNSSHLPRHSHNMDAETEIDGGHSHGMARRDFVTESGAQGVQGGGSDTYTDYAGSHIHTLSLNSESTGGGQEFDNRPPYYVVAFIMKL